MLTIQARFRRIHTESSEHKIAYNVHLLTNLHKQADFWQVNIFHLVLAGYASHSHNFTELVFVMSSLLFSLF